MEDLTVRNHLLGDTAITAMISDRCWTGWLLEKPTYPAITCTYESESPENTFTDTQDGSERIIVNVWADTRSDVNDLVALIKTRMSGFAPRIAILDLSEQEPGIYRYALDYSVW